MKTIAITSGKGGVGKSNITANLGIALSQLGRRVVLFDADLGLANLDVILGVNVEYRLQHALDGSASFDSILTNAPGKVKLIAGGSAVSKVMNISKKRLLSFLEHLSAFENSADYLLMDTAAGIDSRVTSFIRVSSTALLVATPDPASITDAYAVIKCVKRLHSDVEFHVLINMCSGEIQAKSVFHKLQMVSNKYLGTTLHYAGHIRSDSKITPYVRQRTPFILGDAHLAASEDVFALADYIDKKIGREDSSSFSDSIAEIFELGLNADDSAEKSA